MPADDPATTENEGEVAITAAGTALGTAATVSPVIRRAMHRRIKGSDLLFSTTGRTPISGWSRAKARLDAELAGLGLNPEPWRLNDLRSTFAAIARDELEIDRWAIERCLGRVNKFATPLLREWADSPELRLEADAALDRWAALVTG